MRFTIFHSTNFRVPRNTDGIVFNGKSRFLMGIFSKKIEKGQKMTKNKNEEKCSWKFYKIFFLQNGIGLNPDFWNKTFWPHDFPQIAFFVVKKVIHNLQKILPSSPLFVSRPIFPHSHKFTNEGNAWCYTSDFILAYTWAHKSTQ